MAERKPSTYAGYTEARKEANARYEAKTVERISLVLPKGKRQSSKHTQNPTAKVSMGL